VKQGADVLNAVGCVLIFVNELLMCAQSVCIVFVILGPECMVIILKLTLLNRFGT
jgi:hypothetical protein